MRLLIAICALLGCAAAEFSMNGSFALVDADVDGTISKTELAGLGLFNTFDDNKDGNISATEFVTHFQKTGLSQKGSLYVFFSADSNNDASLTTAEVDQLFIVFDNNKDDAVSYLEYASVMNMLLNQLATAGAAEPSLTAMFVAADTDGDGELTKVEAAGLMAAADTDGSGLVSEDEFVVYWRSKTMDSETNAKVFFSILDFDKDGQYGSTAERDAFFDGFDYGNNDKIDQDEFLNSMLNLFAQVMRIVDHGVAAKMTSNSFDAKKFFDSVDTDKDGKVSTDEFKIAVNMTNTNNDDFVSVEEFVKAHMKVGLSEDESILMFFLMDKDFDQKLSKSEFKMAFHHKDRNMDMYIDYEEFTHSQQVFTHIESVAASVSPKVANMMYLADMNGDEKLSFDEMSALYSPADTDMDKEISKKEFTKFWSERTALPTDFSARLYDIYDDNKDDKIDDIERKGTYAAFDYNKDLVVSFEEFKNANLFLFARIVGEMMTEVATKMQGTFNITLGYANFDSNKDGVVNKADSDAAFKAIDKDGDGKLTTYEVVPVYMATGLSDSGALYLLFTADQNDDNVLEKSEIDKSFDDLDLDGNGEVSLSEYTAVWRVLIHQMQEASMAGHKLSKMFDHVDAGMNGNLTSTEMKMLLEGADTDKDGLISKDEFKKFWMMKTGEPSDRTEYLYGMLDEDDDGVLGNDNELLDLFNGFDYNDDNLVSKEEFLNSLLNLFAKTLKGLEMEKAAKKGADAVIGFFF